MKRIVTITILSLLVATTAGAATFPFGFQIGRTVDPDQFHFGGHAYVAEPLAGVDFRPGAELGFGDHMTVIALNGDFLYDFTEFETSDWGFFAGAGLNLYVINYDSDYDIDSESEVGLTGVGGVKRKLLSGNELFFELRLNLVDSPDLKLTVGMTLF